MNKLKGFKLEILMKQRIYEYYFLIFWKQCLGFLILIFYFYF
jgi:hypothetical protein